jgi:heat shock protein HslJ
MTLFYYSQKHPKLYHIGKKLILFLIFIFIVAITATTGCKSSQPQVQPSSAFDRIAFKSGRVPSGIVKLNNGEYREKTSEQDSAQITVNLDDHMATGKGGHNDMAAAILVSHLDGGEVYYDLALLKKTQSGWENTDIVELGDRVKIQSISIEDDEIEVHLKVHGPYDRDCCATLEKTFKYNVSGSKMVKELDPEEQSSPPDLEGTLWKWQETYYKNDRYILSYDPNSYTVQLLKEKRLTVRADCNMAGGGYAVDGEYIDLQITHSTMAACPPESLSDVFLEDLNAATRYYFKNQKLYIVLKNEAGVMVFSL